MGKGRHVVFHDIIHDDNEMGQQTNQLSGRIFTHNLGNSPIAPTPGFQSVCPLMHTLPASFYDHVW